MASASRPRPGAGGKIVRPRRRGGPITPYDRPRLLTNSGERNPSWISKIIFSPTRLIATGAGKVLSSVFGPESSSSSSSSSSGTDFTSEDDMDDANRDDDLSAFGPDKMNEKNGKSQTIKFFQGKPQPVDWNSETKRVIERLLLQETFSREEFERLTHIIKSRVIDSPGMANTQEGIQNRIVDSAIIEAQNWLEEKKLGSTSTLELDPGTGALKSALLPQGIGGEVDSPVDMAKSYMQSRPPWASQSSNRFKSPLPSAVQLFKEETPYSVSVHSVPLSKLKRGSPATGSWNILEEIRRVRSKATEMRTPPSSKNHWCGFTLDYKTAPTALFSDNLEVLQKTDDGSHNNSVLPDQTLTSEKNQDVGPACLLKGTEVLQKPDDGSYNSVLPDQTLISEKNQDVGPACLLKGTEVLQKPDDGSHNSVLPDQTLISEKNQDVGPACLLTRTEGVQDSLEEPPMNSGLGFHPAEDVKVVSHSDTGDAVVDGLKDPNGTNQLLSPVMGEVIQDLMLHEGNGSILKEATGGASDAFASNGFPSFRSSLSAGIDKEQNPAPFNEQISDDADPDKEIEGASVRETREILSEALVEVVVMNENESLAPESQNISSLHHDGPFEDLAQPNPKPSLVGVSQRGRKLSRYNRRGRGRGK